MLPNFRYHPNPLATGNVKCIDAVCECCGKLREFVYTGPVYSSTKPKDFICPWCVADGSAAQKFKATFNHDAPLRKAGLPVAVIEEVTRRTPGYIAWEEDHWLTCCNDSCEFHGDAPHEELLGLKGEALAEILRAFHWEEARWNRYVLSYKPAGNPAVYKFVCIHCRKIQYGLDFS